MTSSSIVLAGTVWVNLSSVCTISYTRRQIPGRMFPSQPLEWSVMLVVFCSVSDLVSLFRCLAARLICLRHWRQSLPLWTLQSLLWCLLLPRLLMMLQCHPLSRPPSLSLRLRRSLRLRKIKVCFTQSSRSRAGMINRIIDYDYSLSIIRPRFHNRIIIVDGFP